MMYLIPVTTHYGTIIGSFADTESPLSGYIDADDVPIPPELSGLADDWEQFIEKIYSPFFLIDVDTLVTTLAPIDQWTRFLDFEGNPNYLQWTINGVDSFFRPSDDIINFLVANWPGEEVVDAYDWDRAYVLAGRLLQEMSPMLNDYLITGTPLDPVFAALNTVLKDLEGTYTVPADAINAMVGGLASFASSLGETWPPPEP